MAQEPSHWRVVPLSPQPGLGGPGPVIGILFAGVDRQFFREVAGNPRQRGRAVAPPGRSHLSRGLPFSGVFRKPSETSAQKPNSDGVWSLQKCVS
jgi:hypothetical protein